MNKENNQEVSSKTKEELLEEQSKLLKEENRLLKEKIKVLEDELYGSRKSPYDRVPSNPYDFTVYYGCPNSKRVKKLFFGKGEKNEK